CRAVCEQMLGETIASGAASVDAVTSACGAGSDCGACLPMIADWIEDVVPLRRLPVKGYDRVVALLNDVLTAELTAINQYFIHARMCENWGYERLWKKIREESIGEMRHADRLIARILYLEGVPNVQRLGKVNVGQTVPEQLRLDLELERDAV